MSAATAATVGTWNIDPSHSGVSFAVKHMGIATVRGSFTEFEGSLELGEDGGSHTARGTVEVASVNTSEAKRDDHLRSPDFFDAEQFPQMVFESTEIELDGDDLVVKGNLTIHGVTNEITLKGEITGTDTDPWGNDRVAVEVSGKLNRGDYGMTFNQALGSGNMLVSDQVKLDIDISAVKA